MDGTEVPETAVKKVMGVTWKVWCIEEQGKVGNGVESVQHSDETHLEKDITKPENVDLPRRCVVKSPGQKDQDMESFNKQFRA